MRAFRPIPVIGVFRKRRFARHPACAAPQTLGAGTGRLETVSDFLCLVKPKPQEFLDIAYRIETKRKISFSHHVVTVADNLVFGTTIVAIDSVEK